MNPVLPASRPRRHVWRWVALGLGLCLTPVLVLALVVASFLSLERDAAVLRRNVMAATDASWHTKIQVSVGRLTIAALRTGLCFVHHRDIADAQRVLAGVNHASVGVYERLPGAADWSREQLFTATDRAMQKRGWHRLVGVADRADTVLIYVPQDVGNGGSIDVCLAVVNGRELVVASTSVDAAVLARFAADHAAGDLRPRLHLAKLGL